MLLCICGNYRTSPFSAATSWMMAPPIILSRGRGELKADTTCIDIPIIYSHNPALVCRHLWLGIIKPALIIYSHNPALVCRHLWLGIIKPALITDSRFCMMASKRYTITIWFELFYTKANFNMLSMHSPYMHQWFQQHSLGRFYSVLLIKVWWWLPCIFVKV